ncbi:MAG TPA: ribonuclease HI family protein [bacterium]|nr:ribonuclease HI family protein [bacterium]
MNSIVIHSDGGARGNPGPAGAGAVLTEQATGKTLHEISTYLGATTNNQAEYQALILALQTARTYQPDRLTCYLDSELIVRQLNGRYRVKHPDLKPLYLKVVSLVGTLPTQFIHIPREKNQRADALANQAMDRRR